MTILLDTPFNPGDMDPGKSYTHVDLVSYQPVKGDNMVYMSCMRGYVEDGRFVAGVFAPEPRRLFNRRKLGETRYDDYLTEDPEVGRKARDAHDHRLELFLAERLYPGTVV